VGICIAPSHTGLYEKRLHRRHPFIKNFWIDVGGINMDNVLKISNLRVAYPYVFGRERTVLEGLNLEVKAGEIFGLLGPNGAGKTTLIKSIVGLISIGKGSITVFGDDPSSPKIRVKLGYMPEIANYYWFMTPAEILRIFGRMCGMKKMALNRRITDILKLVELSRQKDQLVKSFSKGMQARLNIAQALLHDPELLILDEPFSGLDPLGRIHMRNILKEMKDADKTIFLSSHELSEAELICDTICVMKEGAVLRYGPMKALIEEKGEHSLENFFLRVIGGQDA